MQTLDAVHGLATLIAVVVALAMVAMLVRSNVYGGKRQSNSREVQTARRRLVNEIAEFSALEQALRTNEELGLGSLLQTSYSVTRSNRK